MIDRKWLPLNALRAFEAVGRRSSFTGGAQLLNVTQSAISRHVHGLEELIGRRLIDRRSSGMQLTEAGARLLPVLTQCFDRIEQVMNQIRERDDSRQRVLTLHMPPTFLQRVGLQMLHEFRLAYPDIAIDVSSTYGNGLPEREVDVAIVYDKPKVSDDILDLLWMECTTPVCSPELASRFAGRPLAELLAASELLHIRVEGQSPNHLWSEFARLAGIALDTSRGMIFDTLELAVQYARRGRGVVLADVHLFAAEMADGTLGVPSAIECRDGFGYFLCLHPEHLDDPVVSLFRSWVITRFAGRGPEPAAADAIPAPAAITELAADRVRH